LNFSEISWVFAIPQEDFSNQLFSRCAPNLSQILPKTEKKKKGKEKIVM